MQIEIEPDIQQRPTFWCVDCRAFRWTLRDLDGMPVCRVCIEGEPQKQETEK